MIFLQLLLGFYIVILDCSIARKGRASSLVNYAQFASLKTE